MNETGDPEQSFTERARRWRGTVPLVLVALTLATYVTAFPGSFHFDDAHAIVENPSIRSAGNLGRFFTDATTFSVLPQNQNYRPLLLVTYALTAAVTGVSAPAFVAVNLLVHAGCVLLLWLALRALARVLGRREELVPAVAAAVFAVHPLLSECVSYVSARSESLSGLLTLAALLAYLRARRGGGMGALLGAGVAMLAAVITKPVAVGLPLFAALLELGAPERQPWRRIWPRLAVLVAAGALGVTLVTVMTPAVAFASASSFGRLEYLRSELPALFHYLALFVWPFGQSADPAYPVAASWLAPRVLVAGLLLVATSALALLAVLRRRRVEVGLGIAWYLLSILPTSSVFPLAEIVNEHRPYLATAALCPLAALALLRGVPWLLSLRDDHPRAARVGVATVALAVAMTASVTLARNRVWRTELSLWEDVVAGAPRSARAQMNYGLALMEAGRLVEAEPCLREAVRLAPAYPYALINLGQLLLATGRDQEAVPLLDRAVQVGPGLFYAHHYRGLAAERRGEPAGIRAGYFARAVQLSPRFAPALYKLSLAAFETGDRDGALDAARRAVAIRGDFDDRFMLAFLLLERGDAGGALPLLRGLQQERPQDARVAQNLAWAGRLLGGAAAGGLAR